MQNKQFFIEGWKNQSLDNPYPPRNQLKNLIQFIDKAKFQSMRLQDKKQPSLFREQSVSRDEKSQQSVIQCKKNLKNFLQRIKLRSFVEKDREVNHQKSKKMLKQKEQRQSNLLNRVKALNFDTFLTLEQQDMSQQSKFNTIGSKQKCKILPQNRFKSSSSKYFSKHDRFIHRSFTKRQLKLTKNQKKESDIRSLGTLSNEDRMKRLKNILFKTVQQKKVTKETKQYQKYEIKLKNMLQKSNKKKKKLQKLFKVNQWINQSKISTVLTANKIYNIENSQSAKSLKIKHHQSSRKVLHFTNI